MILKLLCCTEETHSNKSMSHGQIVSPTNRSEELSPEADLKDWNIQALHQDKQILKQGQKN